MKTLWLSLRTLLTLTLVLGLVYPLALTGLAQLWMPGPANGSLVRNSAGTVVGSDLIGQDWSSSPAWFQGRPSATGGQAYNPQASGGSNLTPHGAVYADRVAAARQAWEDRARQAGQNQAVPALLLTTSGSGLDPHLTVEAALWQVPLVARERGADPAAVAALVQATVDPVGWPWDQGTVNVLALNQALDQAFPKP